MLGVDGSHLAISISSAIHLLVGGWLDAVEMDDRKAWGLKQVEA